MKFIIRGPENEHIIKNWPLQSLQPWPLITEYLSRRIHWVRSTIIAIPTFWKVATLETVHWYIPKTRDRTQQGTTQIFCFFGNGTPPFSSISHIFGIKNHHSLEYPPVFRPKSSPFSGPLAEPMASCRRRWDCKGRLGSTEGKPLGNMAWGGKLRCWVWGWLEPKGYFMMISGLGSNLGNHHKWVSTANHHNAMRNGDLWWFWGWFIFLGLPHDS